MAQELRRRRGDVDGQDAAAGAGPDCDKAASAPTDADRERLMLELQHMVDKIKAPPKPGLSHDSKKWKDQLAADPYNMDLVQELGESYAADEQWEQAVNVLSRGWKRAGEIQDKNNRFAFLHTLCEASFRIKKYRQALAVLNDIDEPEELNDDWKRLSEILKCQVYCYNGDTQKGLKAFHKAIEGMDFEAASAVWSACIPGFKKVGAFEVTKTTVEGLITKDEERTRLEAVIRLVDLRENIKNEEDVARSGSGPRKYIYMIVAFISFTCLMTILYFLEAQSLNRLQLQK